MRALLLVTLLVVAGCVAPAPTAPDSEPARSSTGSPLPTPTGSCEVAERPSPTNTTGDVEPVAYPEPPVELTTDSVRRYVEAFERAFLHNRRLVTSDPVRYLEVYVDDLTVTQHGGAFVVRLNSYTNGGSLQEGEGETPIVVHWDGAPTPASYLVTSDRVVRAASDTDDHVSLARLRNGTTLACF